MIFPIDRIVFRPEDVDLAFSPLRASLTADAATFVLGAFNPGLTRLPNGNLLLMVRVAEALKQPVRNGFAHCIRWTADGYVLDAYPIGELDLSDPRRFRLHTHFYSVMGLTSLSWLLPVEVSADGLQIVSVHYHQAIGPQASYQDYGVEDPRIVRIDGVYYMTVCNVSAERHGASLYRSMDGLRYELVGLVLDHQNKDMAYFEGRIANSFWALTRPTGEDYFLYSPDSPFHAGPSINLATSPDGVHWKPHDAPFIRPRKGTLITKRIGGGAPPLLTPKGWLLLFHGVAPLEAVGVYRTFWALLDTEDPARILHIEDQAPLLESRPELTDGFGDKLYLHHVVFTTGIADAGDHFIVASGENDLVCRITHVPKSVFS
jgi:predicted GH43/DUF377 family glycosyl hydrolase